ncbi:MAG: hypothetical protein D6698_01640 [Gammaproteobacteria bacterium]|nr:MAG: hypothetical protein D6698_01640 [Gammaproteobacteria bacterium]
MFKNEVYDALTGDYVTTMFSEKPITQGFSPCTLRALGILMKTEAQWVKVVGFQAHGRLFLFTITDLTPDLNEDLEKHGYDFHHGDIYDATDLVSAYDPDDTSNVTLMGKLGERLVRGKVERLDRTVLDHPAVIKFTSGLNGKNFHYDQTSDSERKER